MLAAMAFLTHYNYLSRIGALWRKPINDRLNLQGPIPAFTAASRSD
jgi:hypothetical protein